MEAPHDLNQKDLYLLNRLDKIDEKLEGISNRLGYIYAFASAIGFFFSAVTAIFFK